jgi:hypothetical protein
MTGESGLTRDELFALRHAEDVSFHTLPDGGSYIRAYLRGTYSAPHRVFTVREQEAFNESGPFGDSGRMCEVAVSVVRLEDYSGRTGSYSAYAGYVPRDVWRTIADALRVGDRFGFHWIASNNSESAKVHGFHHDELRLEVEGADRKRQRRYIVAVAFGPDNSARMVTRNHPLTGVEYS